MNTTNNSGYVTASPKLLYVIEHGLLGWGLLSASLWVIHSGLTHEQVSSREILRVFTIFPLSGILFGLILWPGYKRRIKQGFTDITEDVEQIADGKTPEAPQPPR